MTQALENQEQIAAIAKAYNSGDITREQAKEQAQPVIDRINDKARAIAKKYNTKPKLVSFMELMR